MKSVVAKKFMNLTGLTFLINEFGRSKTANELIDVTHGALGHKKFAGRDVQKSGPDFLFVQMKGT